MRQNAKFLALFLLVAGVAIQYAQAANFTVNCDRNERINKTLRLVAMANPQGPNRITVTGGCKENVKIRSMDRLTLITKNGASITDRSHASRAVVDIEDSHSVTVQGFTINGGAQGILCSTASVCYLTGNAIQGPGGFGVDGFGVNVVRGSRAFLESNVIQNWGRGAFIDRSAEVFSSHDVFQNNGGSAIVVINRSYFETLNSHLDNNGLGIEAGGSGVFLAGGTISGNSTEGVRVLAASEAIFSGPTITANGGFGVKVQDGSFAAFLAASITGNLSGLDVDCEAQFPMTRFVDRTGGITNCVEPASPAQARDSMK
jgi:hypothetical protein